MPREDVVIVHPETGSRRAGKRFSSSLQVLSFSVKSFHSMLVSSAVTGLKRLSWATGCALALSMPALAHGGAGGEALKPGEYKASPVITIEGHGGLENNLQGHPRHYAIDGLFGTVLEWGLSNEGSFAIEAAIGPALVWGEAEHFYGQVHVHGPEEVHEEDEDGDEDHAEEGHSDEVVTSASPWRRTDIKGYLSARYQPNQQLSLQATWKPYYITRTQEDRKSTRLNSSHSQQSRMPSSA